MKPVIKTEKLEVATKGENQVVNITPLIQQTLDKIGAKEGFALLFLQSTTSSLTIVEFEEGLLTDIPKAMERFAPKSKDYEHEKAYQDGNGHSHVKSSVMGLDLIIPFQNRSLLLGTWQQIVLVEYDVRPRKRSIIVQIVAE